MKTTFCRGSCVIANMVGNPGEACSVACELKYKNLGADCYEAFGMNWQWSRMQQLCDPEDTYRKQGYFTRAQPASSQIQGVDPSHVSSASFRRIPFLALWGFMFVTVGSHLSLPACGNFQRWVSAGRGSSRLP